MDIQEDKVQDEVQRDFSIKHMKATVEVTTKKTSRTVEVMVLGVFDDPNEAMTYDPNLMNQVNRKVFKKSPPQNAVVKILWLETVTTHGLPTSGVIESIKKKIASHERNILS